LSLRKVLVLLPERVKFRFPLMVPAKVLLPAAAEVKVVGEPPAEFVTMPPVL